MTTTMPHSFTKKDRAIQGVVENQELQKKLGRMQLHYADSKFFNPQYTFTKAQLRLMSKIDILKSLA